MIKKVFTVTIEIDPQKAREVKDGKVDLNAYRNWDINYLGEEGEFVKTIIRELMQNNKYSGISVKAEEVPQKSQFRVRWEETKSILVEAEDEDHAHEIAMDFCYEKATLEAQDILEIIEGDTPVDDEIVWSEESDMGGEDDWVYDQVTGDASLARAVAEGRVDSELKSFEVHFNERHARLIQARNEDEAYDLAKRGEGEELYYDTELISIEEEQDETV